MVFGWHRGRFGGPETPGGEGRGAAADPRPERGAAAAEMDLHSLGDQHEEVEALVRSTARSIELCFGVVRIQHSQSLF